MLRELSREKAGDRAEMKMKIIDELHNNYRFSPAMKEGEFHDQLYATVFTPLIIPIARALSNNDRGAFSQETALTAFLG